MPKYATPTGLTGLLLLGALCLLQACTPYRYGMPEDEWNRLSPHQQQETMRAYTEQERLREMERVRQQELRAREEAARAAEEQHRMREQQRRIERIHRGEAGQYGDLVRVTIRDAGIVAGGKELELEPVTFTIASGETTTIGVELAGRKKKEHRDLRVHYQDGTLYIDGDEQGQKRATRLVYEQSWKRGASYDITTVGTAKLKKARVLVEIVPPRRHGGERH
jgi:HSP20 family molecular chaperone IbpA